MATLARTDPQRHDVPTKRDVHFAYADAASVAWSGAVPEFACAANAVSLMMPYVEPYVAKSVRRAISEIVDPTLRAHADAYVHQELAHHREHQRWNATLSGQCRGLATIERWLKWTYATLAKRRRLGTHLAFAAGSEAVAYAAARWAAEHRRELFATADPEITKLFVWHLAEEVEHKNVAFDVFHAVDGSRLRYTIGMLQSFVLLALFCVLGTTVQLWHQKRLFHPVAIVRLVRWTVTFLFELLPAMLVSALPNHHPSDLADPVYLRQWLAEFDDETPAR